MNIGIIGAGIGGLTAAIATEQFGFHTRVFERAPAFRPVGAGITLGANAMGVYSKLGLREKIENRGNPLEAALLKDASGTILSRVNLEAAGEKCGTSSVAIHRARLHDILLESFNDVSLGHEAVQLRETPDSTICEFKQGESFSAERFIVADGVRSQLRDQLLPPEPVRNANQFCWRGVTPRQQLNEQLSTEARSGVEMWGEGARFGYVPISEDEIYWYAVLSDSLVTFDTADFNALTSFYERAFAPVAAELISQCDPEAIIAQPIADRRPATVWHKGSIAFLGDAIHSTTPNMGQGAGMAIESAYVLGQCLKQYPDSEKAYEEYTRMRLNRCHKVTNQSWIIGKVAHSASPWAGLRNGILKLVPDRTQQRTLADFFAGAPG